MKRKVITFFIILICFLLESTVFHKLRFASICPNLMIITTASFGFMRGKKSGMTVGLISGLFVDLFWGGSLGFYMLVYMFKRLFYDEDIKLPIALIAASELAYGVITYVGVYMLNGDFHFGTYLLHIIIPELVYTILATLILYQIILQINRKLDAEEQRSASRFV